MKTSLALIVVTDLVHVTLIKLADTTTQAVPPMPLICVGITNTNTLLLVYPDCILILKLTYKLLLLSLFTTLLGCNDTVLNTAATDAVSVSPDYLCSMR